LLAFQHDSIDTIINQRLERGSTPNSSFSDNALCLRSKYHLWQHVTKWGADLAHLSSYWL